MPSPILVLTTGGTFDKKYDSLCGSLTFFSSTCVNDIFSNSGISLGNWVIQVLRKDSLELTFDDRELLLLHCLVSTKKRILITHGTDTMQQTAEFLKKHVKEKTIVLVGAMIPNALKNSDAPFNLGAGFIACQLLSEGVYIVMHGRIFEAGNVKKIPDVGKFYTINDSDENWECTDSETCENISLIDEAVHLYKNRQLTFSYTQDGVRLRLDGEELGPYPDACKKIKALVF